MQLYFAGFISSDLVQSILSEFKRVGKVNKKWE